MIGLLEHITTMTTHEPGITPGWEEFWISDNEGDLYVPVGKFACDNDHPDLTWDGADILLIIKPNN